MWDENPYLIKQYIKNNMEKSLSVTSSTKDNSPSGNVNESKAEVALDTGHYYWFLVIYLVLLSALGSFVNDMYTPSLPEMCKFFGCSASVCQLGLTMGMIGLGLGQIILGPVSDRVGRKPVLICSTILFIIAAIVSVFSPTIHFFLVCRLFQGLGASSGYFLAKTIPADVYSGRQLAKLMALVGAINGFAPASAPVIGGVAADAFGWKGVFVILAAFATLVLLLSPILKESLAPGMRVRGPWLKSLKGYLILLKNRPFMIHVALKGLSLGILFAYISSSPFILQREYGFSQTGYGLVTGANAVAVMVGSLIALKFKPFKRGAWIGSWILLISIVGESIALYKVHSFLLFEITIVPALFGLGMIFSVSNTLAMNEGRQRAGEASAILGVAGYIIGAIVSPLVGLGNILHSTAVTFLILALSVIVVSVKSRQLPADLGN